MTADRSKSYWDDIDPTVFIDDDGQAYLYWGNSQCYFAKLKKNMIELDGPIIPVDLPCFTEAPGFIKRRLVLPFLCFRISGEDMLCHESQYNGSLGIQRDFK